MKISYDELRRIYRLEKNTTRLVEVEEDFYNSLHDFISDEKGTYLNSLKKDFSESNARNFSNLKKMVEELFSLRTKKVLSQALIAAHTKEASETHMALPEKEMFQAILKTINKHQVLVLKAFSEADDKEKKSDKNKDLNNLSIRIISDVPSFVAQDMKEYGPFKKGEEVSLPYKIAKLFVSRKIGEIKE
jgi:DNA replication factor GINS